MFGSLVVVRGYVTDSFLPSVRSVSIHRQAVSWALMFTRIPDQRYPVTPSSCRAVLSWNLRLLVVLSMLASCRGPFLSLDYGACGSSSHRKGIRCVTRPGKRTSSLQGRFDQSRDPGFPLKLLIPTYCRKSQRKGSGGIKLDLIPPDMDPQIFSLCAGK